MEQGKQLADAIRLKEKEIQKTSGEKIDLVREEDVRKKVEGISRRVEKSGLPKPHQEKVQGELTKLLDEHGREISALKDLRATVLQSEVRDIHRSIDCFLAKPKVAERLEILAPLAGKKNYLRTVFTTKPYKDGTASAEQLDKDFQSAMGLNADQIRRLQSLLGVAKTGQADKQTVEALFQTFASSIEINIRQAPPPEKAEAEGEKNSSVETLNRLVDEFLEPKNTKRIEIISANTATQAEQLVTLLAQYAVNGWIPKSREEIALKISDIADIFSPESKYRASFHEALGNFTDEYSLLKVTVTDPGQMAKIEARYREIVQKVEQYEQQFLACSDQLKEFFKNRAWDYAVIEGDRDVQLGAIQKAPQAATEAIARMSTLEEATDYVIHVNEVMDADDAKSSKLKAVQMQFLTACKSALMQKMRTEHQRLSFIQTSLATTPMTHEQASQETNKLQKQVLVFRNNCLKLGFLFSDKSGDLTGYSFDIDSDYRDMAFAREAALYALDYHQLIESMMQAGKIKMNHDPWIEENRSRLEMKKAELEKVPEDQRDDGVKHILGMIHTGLSGYAGLNFRKQLEVSGTMRVLLQVPLQTISEDLENMMKSKVGEMKEALSEMISVTSGGSSDVFLKETHIGLGGNVGRDAFELFGDLEGWGWADVSGENEILMEGIMKVVPIIVAAIVVSFCTFGAGAPQAVAASSVLIKSAILGLAITVTEAAVLQRGFEGGFGGFLLEFGPRAAANSLATLTGVKIAQYSTQFLNAAKIVASNPMLSLSTTKAPRLMKGVVMTGEAATDFVSSTAISAVGESVASGQNLEEVFSESLKSGLILTAGILGVRIPANAFASPQAVHAIHALGESQDILARARLKAPEDVSVLLQRAETEPHSLNIDERRSLALFENIPEDAQGTIMLIEKTRQLIAKNPEIVRDLSNGPESGVAKIKIEPEPHGGRAEGEASAGRADSEPEARTQPSVSNKVEEFVAKHPEILDYRWSDPESGAASKVKQVEKLEKTKMKEASQEYEQMTAKKDFEGIKRKETADSSWKARVERTKKLQKESPAIQEAMGHIQRELEDSPELIEILRKYLEDVDHPIDISAYLKDPLRRDAVLEHLKAISKEKNITEAEFLRVVDSTHDASRAIFRTDDIEFTYLEGRKKAEILSERILAENPELFSLGDSPAATQRLLLQQHAERLATVILPKFRSQLEAIVAPIKQKGFPPVNTRAKSAEGMIDKIKRMRRGNGGKAPRPDYSLKDMPDAVGGRITVRDPAQMESMMQRIEETFGRENIFEKDSFYSNPKKKNSPYRVITYTVTVDGVPCELQLTTLDSSLVADLNHNVVYKGILPTTRAEKSYVADMQRKATAKELRAL